MFDGITLYPLKEWRSQPILTQVVGMGRSNRLGGANFLQLSLFFPIPHPPCCMHLPSQPATPHTTKPTNQTETCLEFHFLAEYALLCFVCLFYPLEFYLLWCFVPAKMVITALPNWYLVLSQAPPPVPGSFDPDSAPRFPTLRLLPLFEGCPTRVPLD